MGDKVIYLTGATRKLLYKFSKGKYTKNIRKDGNNWHIKLLKYLENPGVSLPLVVEKKGFCLDVKGFGYGEFCFDG